MIFKARSGNFKIYRKLTSLDIKTLEKEKRNKLNIVKPL